MKNFYNYFIHILFGAVDKDEQFLKLKKDLMDGDKESRKNSISEEWHE